MNVLFIDACPRGEGVSRTLTLADAFFKALRDAYPGAAVIPYHPSDAGLLPMDGPALARREALIDARAWDDPLFAPARALLAADSVVVAAPYWDLLFPAILKVYIEHVSIRELTFRYENDAPTGLCGARRALFLTTAGDRLNGNNLGERYLREALAVLGIRRFDSVCADGLDLAGADIAGRLSDAAARAAAFGHDWQRAL